MTAIHHSENRKIVYSNDGDNNENFILQKKFCLQFKLET
jgi:hypothetical protein